MKSEKAYEDMLKIIANNIRSQRKKRGLTQEDMVDLGFNYRFYQKLESGHYSPNLSTLFRVTQVLDISMIELFKKK